MKKITELLMWVFSSKYRKKQWSEELSLIQDQIRVVERELSGREEFIHSIHAKAVDKGSSFEKERSQGRIEEMKHNNWLLKECLKREKLLRKKLKIAYEEDLLYP